MSAETTNKVDSRRRDFTKSRDMVGISLMGSEEATAAVALVRKEMPNVKIQNRDCYVKIESADLLEFDMAKLSEHLGRPLKVHDFLVNMSTYYGRIVVNDGVVQIHSEILPKRFCD